MTQNKQNIIDRIKKLKAKAEDSSCTEAEAQMFAAKVAKLMEEHVIQQHELESGKAEHIKNTSNIKYLNPWRRNLINACANATFCKIVWSDIKGNVHVVGRPLNVQVFYDMYYHIEKQIIQIGRSLYPKDGKLARRAENGLADGIAIKIKQSKQSTQDSRLPVIQEIKEVKKAASVIFPNMKNITLRQTKQSKEYFVGYSQAGRIKLREDIE